MPIGFLMEPYGLLLPSCGMLVGIHSDSCRICVGLSLVSTWLPIGFHVDATCIPLVSTLIQVASTCYAHGVRMGCQSDVIGMLLCITMVLLFGHCGMCVGCLWGASACLVAFQWGSYGIGGGYLVSFIIYFYAMHIGFKWASYVVQLD